LIKNYFPSKIVQSWREDLLRSAPVIGLPVFAENVRRILQKLLLPVWNLVRMNLVTLGKRSYGHLSVVSNATLALNAGA
jgi:hypothetical protein